MTTIVAQSSVAAVDPASSSVPRPEAHQVGALARRGAIWTAGLIVSRHAINLGSTAILARFVTPDAYGLVGMAATLTALLQTFADGGLSVATIQRKDLTQGQVHNLFWVNTLAGAALSFACLLLAPAVAAFYRRDELGLITAVMGLSFLLSGVAVQPMALLNRHMRFRQISSAEFAGTLAAPALGISLALAGFGVWALVGQALAGQLVRTFAYVIISDYRPSRPRRHQGTGALLCFGGHLMAFGFVTIFSRNLDNVLIGKYWGTEELGYYSRAYFLMMLPTMLATGALTAVMVPSLSSLQHDPERLGAAYRKAVQMLAFFACPAAVMVGVAAPEIVRIIYGDQWLPVVPMLVWLSIAGVTQPIHNTTRWLYTASGKSGRMFAWGCVAAVTLAAAFAIGVPWGGVGVAVSYAVAMALALTAPALWLAHRAAGLRVTSTFTSVSPILFAAALTGLSVWVLGRVAAPWSLSPLVILSAKTALGGSVYLAVIAVLEPALLAGYFRLGRSRPGN